MIKKTELTLPTQRRCLHPIIGASYRSARLTVLFIDHLRRNYRENDDVRLQFGLSELDYPVLLETGRSIYHAADLQYVQMMDDK